MVFVYWRVLTQPMSYADLNCYDFLVQKWRLSFSTLFNKQIAFSRHRFMALVQRIFLCAFQGADHAIHERFELVTRFDSCRWDFNITGFVVARQPHDNVREHYFCENKRETALVLIRQEIAVIMAQAKCVFCKFILSQICIIARQWERW